MNKIFFFLISILFSFTAKAQLTVDAPFFAGKKLVVLAFEGLQTDTVWNSCLDDSGHAVIPRIKNDFVLLQFNNSQVYPMLYPGKENRFSLLPDGLPDFSGYPQNDFFMRNLMKKKMIRSRIRVLDESILKFGNDDTLVAALTEKKASLEEAAKRINRLYIDSSMYAGSFLIGAMGILEDSYTIKTEADLAVAKQSFFNFIRSGYRKISGTDMLQQLANQFMMMNEYVVVGKSKMENTVIQDIRDWMVLLDDHYSRAEVLHYFLKYYRSRRMITLSGALVNAFEELASCNVSSRGNGEIILNKPFADNLFVLMDVDCPASVAGQVMIHRFLRDQKIHIPSVTVFCGRTPAKDDYHVLPDTANARYFPGGIRKIGSSEIKISSYPAFILINKSGRVKTISYTLKDAERDLMEWSEENEGNH
ncbi:MAG: hypothetical protein ACM3N9_00330 [Syntrophothermus sp.]